ncbi:HIT domain-containing protein [Sandaracinobacteroides saxicola]|uniref:HIT domain-containing protein n=1 Tax=Sandaracinobacteroides saxicola TaxID=2759707 RepID=A0A7G5IFF0_9SPHN|nr:HIT domain-containing protein [Sandaracinobacteroides saxicola]QMW22092.1 HIT domain-containing protein [Sandaracinobacteroides saxicola]
MPVNTRDPYDPTNIFARILRGEIPCREIYQDAHALAFHDINPQAPVHALVIPRGAYVSLADFTVHASDAEIAGLWRAVGITADLLALTDPGYRILSNIGGHGHQEVPHLHVHLFGGRQLGAMLPRT